MAGRVSCLLLGMALSLTALPLAAEQDLDAVLQGFDEPADSASDAAGDAELDAVLGGFDDSPQESDTQSEVIIEQKPWQLGGDLLLSTSWNYAHDAPQNGETDYRGLSRLRTKLNLGLDIALAQGWDAHLAGYGWQDAAFTINDRNDYPDKVLDEYESELELGEAWLRGRVGGGTDIKLGRQIVVWGKSDNIRITDVINPMDNREPGMVDIEDLRLPLAMARVDHYIGDWGFSAMAIPEIRFNKTPPYGSDFYPYPAPPPREDIPADGGGNTEFALAANGIFSGWDLSLYWARLFDDNPYAQATPAGPELRHARITMTGFATNVATGNWLLKAEAAHFSGLRFASLPDKRLNRLDTLIGVEFSGFRDTTLTLEVANHHLPQHEQVLLTEGIEENEWQTALRYQADFLHARLQLVALLTAFGRELDEGGFSRYSMHYDLADALTLGGGVVAYHGGEQQPFSAIADNDRLFLELKYSF